MGKTNKFIKVSFHEPKDGRKDYYFGSIGAIFTEFDREDVGCTLQGLYRKGLPAETVKCVITRETLVRKRHAGQED